ncbi:hypothetical protein NQ314_003216 [Rhamnusium bicolor]|uniref:DUF7869 domain-containing protein n=1 Tax=Rhamnusium bicolor TaxID=1586634 RepID=A0AAV8ZPQ5_9CUCU|nr:hypothetical protein NQ314_003216 [Rhamnusium bicolor]
MHSGPLCKESETVVLPTQQDPPRIVQECFNNDNYSCESHTEIESLNIISKSQDQMILLEKNQYFPECSRYNNRSSLTKVYTPNATVYVSSNQEILDDLGPPSPEDPFATDSDPNDREYYPTDQNSSSEIEDEAIQCNKNNENKENEVSKEETNKNKEKSRKRKRDYKNWRRNIIKKSRNSGKSYMNWKGKQQQARELKLPCDCRMKCREKISPDLRQNIFKEYWELADVNRQRDFISKFVDFKKTSRTRRRTHTADNVGENNSNEAECSRRQLTFVYHLNNDSKERIQVCKIFFLNTLCICAQVVKTVLHKKLPSGSVVEDKRGKVLKNSQVDDTFKQHVRDHINSFEPIESHYCRKKSQRLYLPSNLNITKMYGLYQEYCVENKISKLLQIEYDVHLHNKKLAKDVKNSDKEKAAHNNTFCAAVFDLQQILPVPKSEVGLCYYKLKLSTYNFTIYSLGNRDCFCYMWYECIAKRGSSEIGSCLLSFVLDHIHKGVKEFSFYSDNCAGQNRNKFLFSLYNYLSQKYKITIRHSFMERGHTQNEGDSVHSTIENASRHVPIFSPDQWITLVRTVRKNQPYIVKEISQENIFDLKKLQQDTTLNWDKDDENEKVSWLKIKIIESNSSFPNILLFKYEYDNNQLYRKINLLQKGRKKMVANIENINLTLLYSQKIPLTKKKYEHLQFLCNKLVIASQYHEFFERLPYIENNVTDRETDEED